MKLRLVLPFFLLLLALPAGATPVLEACMQEFAKAGCYLSGNCHTNAVELLNLAKKFRDPDFDLQNARVLYVRPAPGKNLEGFRDGASPPVQWGFHVLVESGGKIFDPDFLQAPGGVPTTEYLRKMFRVGEGKNEGMRIRTVPATDYLNEFGHHDPKRGSITFSYYLSDQGSANERYPYRTVSPAAPEKSIVTSAPAQPLRASEEPRLEIYDEGVDMRDGANRYILLSTEGRLVVQGPSPPGEEGRENFLRAVAARAEVDSAVADHWRTYRAQLEQRAKLASGEESAPAVGSHSSFTLTSREGILELAELDGRPGALAVERASMPVDAFVEELRAYAKAASSLKEVRINFEVYGGKEFRREVASGTSRADAVKMNPVYLALRPLGFRIDEAQSALDGFDPFLTMVRAR